MELMANFKVDIKKVEEKFEIDFFEYFKNDLTSLEEFEDANLVKIENKKDFSFNQTKGNLMLI